MEIYLSKKTVRKGVETKKRRERDEQVIKARARAEERKERRRGRRPLIEKLL
jgi:hypothetical protein